MPHDPEFIAETRAWLRKAEQDLESARILGAAVEIASDLDDLLREASVLTDYAWMYRYPGASVQLDSAEARRAENLAQRVLEAVLHRLPEETHPQ